MELFQISDEEKIGVYQIDGYVMGMPRRRMQACVKRIKSWIEHSKMLPPTIRLRALLRKIKPEFMLPGATRLIPSKLIEEAIKVVDDGNYVCLIGVEKAGLIWAGMVGERTGLPWIYHSLELFTSDNDFVTDYYARYRKAEKLYHQKAVATIIQDQERADVLFKDNEIQNGKALFVPVSIMGEALRERSDYLRKKHDIPRNKVVVLQFGQINEWRLCKEIMLEACDVNQDIVLIMHGVFSEGKQQYMHTSSGGMVILSDKLVPYSEVGKLISSADIGLVFYRKSPLNQYLTGSASEKLALYLQAGVPVIMFDYPSFRQLNDKYQFGVCIGELRELEQAIATILDNYSYYRDNAFAAFTDHYEFRRNFEKVIDYIDSLE